MDEKELVRLQGLENSAAVVGLRLLAVLAQLQDLKKLDTEVWNSEKRKLLVELRQLTRTLQEQACVLDNYVSFWRFSEEQAQQEPPPVEASGSTQADVREGEEG